MKSLSGRMWSWYVSWQYPRMRPERRVLAEITEHLPNTCQKVFRQSQLTLCKLANLIMEHTCVQTAEIMRMAAGKHACLPVWIQQLFWLGASGTKQLLWYQINGIGETIYFLITQLRFISWICYTVSSPSIPVAPTWRIARRKAAT
jgi:hypothetical protein